jgi:DNA-binding PadR family transcriptional regulator
VETPSSTELVILGLLKRQPAHGYELLRTVRTQQMSEYMRVAPSGLYKALARLEDQGCVTARAERDGNRPERQTYSITGKGEVRLQKLLLDHLRAAFEHADGLSAALTFSDLAPREAIKDELHRRLEMVVGSEEEAARLLAEVLVPEGERFFFERLRVGRWAEHLAAERRWLEKAIASLNEAQHQPTLDEPVSKAEPDPPTRSHAHERPARVEEPVGRRRGGHKPGWPRAMGRDGGPE